jgi:hypothetical protein
MRAAHEEADAEWRRLSQELKQVEPSSWTRRIENAIGNPTELQAIARSRDEALITYAGVDEAYRRTVGRVYDLRSRIAHAIAGVIAACQEGRDDQNRGDDRVGAMKNNVVLASRLRGQEVPGDRQERDAVEVLTALRRAFGGVVATLASHRPYKASNNYVGYSLTGLYPTEPAVPLDPPRRDGGYADQRHVRFVEFVDSIADDNKFHLAYPGCVALSQLLPCLQEAFQQAVRCRDVYRTREKGRVNERQYAARLVQSLEDTACGYERATADVKARQDELRLDYESARQAWLAAITCAERLRAQVVDALRQAVTEVEKLDELARNGKERREVVTTTVYRFDRLGLINCVAAGAMLRRCGAELSLMFDEVRNDLTQGNGSQALLDAYRKCVASYSYLLPKRDDAGSARTTRVVSVSAFAGPGATQLVDVPAFEERAPQTDDQAPATADQITELSKGGFVANGHNVILYGPACSGKTELTGKIAQAVDPAGKRVVRIEELGGYGIPEASEDDCVSADLLIVELAAAAGDQRGSWYVDVLQERRRQRKSTILISRQAPKDWLSLKMFGAHTQAVLERLDTARQVRLQHRS